LLIAHLPIFLILRAPAASTYCSLKVYLLICALPSSSSSHSTVQSRGGASVVANTALREEITAHLGEFGVPRDRIVTNFVDVAR